MKIFEHMERIQLFHKMVEQRRTGTPDECAARLHIKRTCLYEMIEELKSHGVELGYSRQLCTFYYKCNVVIDIRFSVNIDGKPDSNELKNISGGYYFSLPSFFCERNNLTFT